MALPKIDFPVFPIKVPSKNKDYIFRPFLSKEEKILLFANESGDKADMVRAIKQVISLCAIDDLDIKNLSTVDVEYVYLKLVARSINNIIKASFRDEEDGKIYDFDIDLNKIEVVKNEKNNPVIKITDDIGMILKAPDADIDELVKNITDRRELYDKVLQYCVVKIYDKDTVYIPEQESEEDIKAFLDSLPHDAHEKVGEFFDTLPTLDYEINYKNSLGHDRKIVMNTLSDFFI